MTIAHDFEYVRPGSLDEAVAAMAEPGARVLAGGTDLVAWLRDDLVEPTTVVDIKHVPGLSGIEEVAGKLRMGALATFSDLIASDLVRDRAPMLAEMAHHVASIGIRNRATVAGNLCSAVPSLDAGPPLLAFDGEITAIGPAGVTTMAVEDLFEGPRNTRLGPGEIVTAVTVPIPPDRYGAAFVKLGRYAGEDLAQANLAVLITESLDYRVAFGAVAPVPLRARSIEQALAGAPPDPDRIEAAVSMVADEISPITDLRASAQYREHMCRIMLRRALQAAWDRLTGLGAPYPSEFV
jgi:CO/xanthine dehydrogenase FAD-binding subunit